MLFRSDPCADGVKKEGCPEGAGPAVVDAKGGDPAMTGFDAAVVKDGVITDLWTVLIPPTQ